MPAETAVCKQEPTNNESSLTNTNIKIGDDKIMIGNINNGILWGWNKKRKPND